LFFTTLSKPEEKKPGCTTRQVDSQTILLFAMEATKAKSLLAKSVLNNGIFFGLFLKRIGFLNEGLR
jgi:hypothetical protein